MAIKDKGDLIGKAKRTSLLRSITGYSRREFCEKTKIAERTLQFWEKGEGNGITEEGARILLKACEQLGIYANYDWLMHGFGNPPFLDEKKQSLYFSHSADNRFVNSGSEEAVILMEELELFRQHYPDAIDLTIEDDSMYPIYKNGDFVAGRCYYDEEIIRAVGHDCIVVIKNAKKLLRHLTVGSSEGYYTLAAHNFHSTAKNLILQDIELVSAAPILWLRRIIV